MKFQRLLLALTAGLGLTLALNFVLSTGWEATAAPLSVPVEGLSAEGWNQIIAQLNQAGSYSYLVSQTKKLTATDGATGDYFGCAVTIDGDTLVVGAREDDTGRGSVYLFTRNEDGADNWGLTAHITATDGKTDDKFGYAVDVSGDTLVVGARGDNVGGGTGQGSAYIFTRNEGGADSWGQTAHLTATDGAEGDEFGIAVAVDGDTIVVGASGGYGEVIDYGSAYLFTRNEGGADNWGLTAHLTSTDVMTEDLFGRSVAVSGDAVVVGAPHDSGAYFKSGSVYLFTRNEGGVADNWGQAAKITATDSITRDYFGWAVTLSGDTLVVGVENDDDNGQESGSAYVFARNEGGADNWGQVANITPTDADSFDSFGRAVALNGDTLVVGAYHGDEYGYFSGSAYLFARNEGGADNWGQVAKITATDGGEWDTFGGAVAASGETIVVGAHGDDSYTGSAYLFTCTGDTWFQEAQPAAADGAEYDRFGYAVDVSGDTLVVGAYGDGDNGSESGSAYIFTRNTGGADNWGQTAKITATDGTADDYFGDAVAVSGDTVVVGAYGDDGNGSESGSAYIFTRNQGGADNWGQTAKITATDGAASDNFGYAVSIDGDTIVVGAYGDGSGSAYIFTRNEDGADNWGQTAKITATDGAADDYFGHSVSIDGDTIIVGAWYDDDNGSESGSAYIFTRNQGGADNWGQTAKITATDGAAGDNFGVAVSIDGDTIVVGAIGDGENGDDSGSAYLFARNEGGADNWGQVTRVTATDVITDDQFGVSVAVDGDTAVVGAYYGDGVAIDSGSAYVFRRNEGGMDNWGQTAKITATYGAYDDWFGYSVALCGNGVVIGAPYAEEAYVYRYADEVFTVYLPLVLRTYP